MDHWNLPNSADHRVGEDAMHAGVHASAVEAMPGWSRGPCPGRPSRNLLPVFRIRFVQPSNANGVALKPASSRSHWASLGGFWTRKNGRLDRCSMVANRAKRYAQ